MITRSIYVFILCLLIPGAGASCYAQCCSAGNPMGGDLLQGSVGQHSLRLITQYKHSYSEQYYHEDHPEDVPQVNYSQFNYMNVQFIYGISRKLNVFGELGYFFDKSQSVSVQGEHLLQAKGIGDLTLNAKYVVFTSRDNTKELNISGGIKLPVGAFDQEQDGAVLPLSLQPSNGSTKYSGSIYYFHRPNRSKLGFYVVGTMDINATIQSENYYYKYGNVYIASLSGTYKTNEHLNCVLQMRTEVRGQDEREGDQMVASTGSAVVFVAPILQYSFLQDWEMTAQADYPVYKYVRGYQLTNKYGFSVSLARRISFEKNN